MTALALVATALALAGAGLALLAARALARLAQTRAATEPALPASILKPLHGAIPGLADNLAATLAQIHGAPFELLAGLRDPADPAAPIAAAALGEGPGRLVIDPTPLGTNAKVAQLANLAAVARHPVLVAADDDIRVGPGWLTAVTAPLIDPRVGLVTCLYRGEAADLGLWSRLAALGIDWQFLPHAAFGEAIGRAQGCYGATIAIRADTLAVIGGFVALADTLADDHALGAAVRRAGLRVVLAPVLPAHRMAEPSLRALFAHELRWARTVRGLDRAGYWGAGITHPLAWALLAAALGGGGWVVAVAFGARLAAVMAIDRALGRAVRPGRLALLPLRDMVSAAVWVAGLVPGAVVWQGRRFRVDAAGGMRDG